MRGRACDLQVFFRVLLAFSTSNRSKTLERSRGGIPPVAIRDRSAAAHRSIDELFTRLEVCTATIGGSFQSDQAPCARCAPKRLDDLDLHFFGANPSGDSAVEDVGSRASPALETRKDLLLRRAVAPDCRRAA